MWLQETRDIALSYSEKMYFIILNRLLGVAHECEGRTDRQTEPPIAISPRNIVRRALK